VYLATSSRAQSLPGGKFSPAENASGGDYFGSFAVIKVF
jgi:hypothetical protein